ncbi:MAG: cupin domain-containing protein [Firmicutes bacterium]|jgi:quercetin dioxygenase-like cupin family protein|nr:cupin domain-containing protein [Bacillota bacterium]
MVRNTDEHKVVNEPRGGKGSMKLHKLMTEEELHGETTLIARVVLDPSSEIGYHRHVGEIETYYVMSGQGMFKDEDGVERPIGPGQIGVIHDGQCHGIRNLSDEEPLVILAVVVNKAVNR